MLTNNNLHTVRIIIKTKTEVKQAVRKNKEKAILFISTMEVNGVKIVFCYFKWNSRNQQILWLATLLNAAHIFIQYQMGPQIPRGPKRALTWIKG